MRFGEKRSLLLWCSLSLLCLFPGRFVGDTHTVLSEVKLSLLHGLWQKRDEYVLMIEMMVNNTLSTRHLTVLLLVFECFCVLVVTDLRGQNLVLDGQILLEEEVIPRS